jgi:hypothetical protein
MVLERKEIKKIRINLSYGHGLRNGKQITLPSDSFFSSSLHDLNRHVELLYSS